MPFIRCGACHQKVRVPEDSLGQKRPCPHCNAIIAIPLPGQTPSSSAPTNPGVSGERPVAPTMRSPASPSIGGAVGGGSQWYLKTAEGQTFGPISHDELNGWVVEGRVTAQDQVLQEGTKQWQWASNQFPLLQGGASAGGGQVVSGPIAAAPPGSGPFISTGEEAQRAGGKRKRPKRPHRGGMILAFGILSWFVPLGIILAIAAWVMGNGDLKAMRAGRMDPSGRGMTNAGMIIGIVRVGFVVLVLLVLFLVVFAGALTLQ